METSRAFEGNGQAYYSGSYFLEMAFKPQFLSLSINRMADLIIAFLKTACMSYSNLQIKHTVIWLSHDTRGLFNSPAPPEPVYEVLLFISVVQQWHPLNHGVSLKRCRNGTELVHSFSAPSILAVQNMVQVQISSAADDAAGRRKRCWNPAYRVRCVYATQGIYTPQKSTIPAVWDLSNWRK